MYAYDRASGHALDLGRESGQFFEMRPPSAASTWNPDVANWILYFFLYPESFWIVFLIKITHQKPSISNGIVTTPWLHTLNSFCCLVLFSASKQHIVRTCFFYILAKGLNSSGGAWQVWNFMTWSSPLPCGILLVKRWRHKPKKKQTTSC